MALFYFVDFFFVLICFVLKVCKVFAFAVSRPFTGFTTKFLSSQISSKIKGAVADTSMFFHRDFLRFLHILMFLFRNNSMFP